MPPAHAGGGGDEDFQRRIAGAGAHPGATVLPPALAIAQERGADGRALIAAFVAGNEVMIRIGRATGHTNEARGFHAPGTTGPFGGAVAVGKLLKFDAAAMTNALGIAGSLSCGLLESIVVPGMVLLYGCGI